MERLTTRRAVLGAGIGGLAAAGLATTGTGAVLLSRPGRTRVLRLAHLTDTHVQPERAAHEGFAACLRHVQSQDPAPDLIIAGGDNVMDVMGRDAERGRVQLELWRKVLKQECSLPVEHVIGNHDVWGWNKAKSKTIGDEDLWGKKWALDAYGLPGKYRAFERAGWKFIVLDSTFPKDDGYTARLDDEQFAWLSAELDRTEKATPVLVASHIPIFCACAFFDGENEKTGDWVVPGSWMHIDARRIKDLFLKHPNVRLCLSGHIHLVDRVEYLGVTYLCNGAVSGGWWKGANQECNPGYGLVDLYDDGTFENRYVEFPWKPRE